MAYPDPPAANPYSMDLPSMQTADWNGGRSDDVGGIDTEQSQRKWQRQQDQQRANVRFRSDVWLGLVASSGVVIASLLNSFDESVRYERSDVELTALAMAASSMVLAFATGVGLRCGRSRPWLTVNYRSGQSGYEDHYSMIGKISEELSKLILSSTLETMLSILNFFLWCCIASIIFNPEHSLAANQKVMSLEEEDEQPFFMMSLNNNLYFSTWASFGLAAYLTCDLSVASIINGTSQVTSQNVSGISRREDKIARAWLLLLIFSTMLFSFCVASMNNSGDGAANGKAFEATDSGATFGVLGIFLCLFFFAMKLLSKMSIFFSILITPTRMITLATIVSFTALAAFAANIVISATSLSSVSSTHTHKWVYSCNIYFASLICLGISIFLGLRHFEMHSRDDTEECSSNEIGHSDRNQNLTKASQRSFVSQCSGATSFMYSSDEENDHLHSSDDESAGKIKYETEVEVSNYTSLAPAERRQHTQLNRPARDNMNRSSSRGSRRSQRPQKFKYHGTRPHMTTCPPVSDPPSPVGRQPEPLPTPNYYSSRNINMSQNKSRAHDPSVSGRSRKRVQEPSCIKPQNRLIEPPSCNPAREPIRDPSLDTVLQFEPSVRDRARKGIKDPSVTTTVPCPEPDSPRRGKQEPSIAGAHTRRPGSFHYKHDPVVSSSDQESGENRKSKRRQSSKYKKSASYHAPPRRNMSSGGSRNCGVSSSCESSGTRNSRIDPSEVGSIDVKSTSYSFNDSSGGLNKFLDQCTLGSMQPSVDKKKAAEIAYNAIYDELRRRQSAPVSTGQTSTTTQSVEKQRVNDVPASRRPLKTRRSTDSDTLLRKKASLGAPQNGPMKNAPSTGQVPVDGSHNMPPHHPKPGTKVNLRKNSNSSNTRSSRFVHDKLTDVNGGASDEADTERIRALSTKSYVRTTSKTFEDLRQSRGLGMSNEQGTRTKIATGTGETATNDPTKQSIKQTHENKGKGNGSTRNQEGKKEPNEVNASRRQPIKNKDKREQRYKMNNATKRNAPHESPGISPSIQSEETGNMKVSDDRRVSFQINSDNESMYSQSVARSLNIGGKVVSTQKGSNFDRTLNDLMNYIMEAEEQAINSNSSLGYFHDSEESPPPDSRQKKSKQKPQAKPPQRASNKIDNKKSASVEGDMQPPTSQIHIDARPLDDALPSDQNARSNAPTDVAFYRRGTGELSAVSELAFHTSSDSLFDDSLDELMNYIHLAEEESSDEEEKSEDFIRKTVRNVVSSARRNQAVPESYRDRRTSENTVSSMYAC